VVVGNSYLCDCYGGFTGVNCEISLNDSCASNPCMNNGICTVNSNTGGFTCTCPGGFTGLFCENSSPSNPCSSSPCGVSGTCQVSCQSPLAYTCQCFSGFSGRNCETRKYWIRSNHFRIDFRVILIYFSKGVCNHQTQCNNAGTSCILDASNNPQCNCTCPNLFTGNTCAICEFDLRHLFF
jgi:hypothetical protein